MSQRVGAIVSVVQKLTWRCDVCGKSTPDRFKDEWVSLSARVASASWGTVFLQRVHHGVVQRGEVNAPIDLCSRECAATWLFGAP